MPYIRYAPLVSKNNPGNGGCSGIQFYLSFSQNFWGVLREGCTYVVPNCEISYSNAPCVEYLATFGHQKSCIDGKHVDRYSIPGACGIVNDNTTKIDRHSYHWMIILGPPYCLRVVEPHSIATKRSWCRNPSLRNSFLFCSGGLARLYKKKHLGQCPYHDAMIPSIWKKYFLANFTSALRWKTNTIFRQQTIMRIQVVTHPKEGFGKKDCLKKWWRASMARITRIPGLFRSPKNSWLVNLPPPVTYRYPPQN